MAKLGENENRGQTVSVLKEKEGKWMRFALRNKILLILAISISFISFGKNIYADSGLKFSGIENSINHKTCGRILERVYDRIGIKIRIQTFPANRALNLSNSGEFDGEVQRIDGISEDYPNLIKVPEPIFYLEACAFVKNTEIRIKGWKSLKPYRIGIPRGFKYLENNTDGMNRLVVSSIEQLFYLLNEGRIDIVIISKNYGQAFLKAHRDMRIRQITPPIIKVPLYHYLHKKHNALVPVVEARIKKMKEEGIISNIIEKLSE